MAQVPYSPVPDVAPSGQGVSPMHISVPEGASGENIGRAMGQLGRVLEHSGDELFATAMKLQEQKNQAEALEAEAKYSLGLTDIHTKFATQEGRNPSDNLMQYKDDVDGLRKSIREGLSSDAVRRMYDRNSLQSMQIAIRNGASHAASQLKAYSKTQYVSTQNLSVQRAFENPNDPIDYLLADAEKRVRESTRADGLPPERVTEDVKKAQSDIIVGRIEGMIREKPLQAQELLNGAVAKGQIWGADVAARLQGKIEAQVMDVGTRNVAHTAVSDPSDTESVVVEKAKAQAEEERPGDLKYSQVSVDKAIGLYRQREAVKKGDAARDMEMVKEAIIAKDAKTVDDLFMDPNTDAAIRRLPVSERMDLQGKINRYQTAKNKPINDEEIQRLISLRKEDPIAFADLDPTKLPLNASQMKEVAAWQKADRKKPHEDAKVGQAMKWLRENRGAELEALKVYSRKKDVNEAEYDRFQGGVSIALDVWKDTHGKYPSQQEFLKDLAPSLIVREMKPGFFYGQNVKREGLIFDPVPAWWDKQFRDKYRMDTGLELQEHEVQRNFLRYRLMLAEDIKKEQKGQRGAGGL